MTGELALLSATELLHGYRRKQFSPLEVTEAVLRRIAALDSKLNAFILLDPEGALAAARASTERWAKRKPVGRVDGVPTTVKDLILTKGWPTLRGSKAVDATQPWTDDAPSVAPLRAEGAILLGKTTTPEFGWKGVTDSPLTGITRNPWNPAKTPGGSSGGAAAAAAAGFGALHFGTDGGGSIRIPAGFTGIVGLKPSFGRVPAFPASPFGTLAHIGPMARTVADTALMLTVMAQPDARDWYQFPHPCQDFRHGLEDGVGGLRIAVAKTLAGAAVDPEVAALVATAAARFAELGAVVGEAAPDLPDCNPIFRILWFAGAANLLRSYTPEQRAQMDQGLLEVASEGARIGILDYLAATKARESVGQAMKAFHRRYDLLLLPTLPVVAFEAGVERPPGQGRWTDWTPFSYPFNLSQQPAISVPAGLTKSGLPVGLQIVGPMHDDALVLRAAAAYEKLAGPFPLPKLQPT
jgi:aspartyl-tRNA(Asn)/glutamyl-tRNA(Gln) amidotransferase subunit A